MVLEWTEAHYHVNVVSCVCVADNEPESFVVAGNELKSFVWPQPNEEAKALTGGVWRSQHMPHLPFWEKTQVVTPKAGFEWATEKSGSIRYVWRVVIATQAYSYLTKPSLLVFQVLKGCIFKSGIGLPEVLSNVKVHLLQIWANFGKRYGTLSYLEKL